MRAPPAYISRKTIIVQAYVDFPKYAIPDEEMIAKNFIKPLTTIRFMVAHASVACSKPKVELDSHADTCVVSDNI